MSVAEKLPHDLNRSAVGNVDERRASYLATRDEFRRELAEKIRTLDLTANVAELDMQGYTVVKDAAPMAFFAELRDHIVALAEERKRQGLYGDRRGVFSDNIMNCTSKGRPFEQVLMNPKLNALMAYLLGDGYVLNASSSAIVEQGAPALPIHCDNAYVPDPFPSWALTATSVWFTEDVTADNGASRVIPGSHRYGRQPFPGEGEEDAVAVECPAGSVAVWNGALWHGNCGRLAPGERVTFHTSFCRLHMKPFANNDIVPQEVIDRNGPLMAQILGRGLPMGREGEDGPNPEWRAIAGRLATRRL
jgi:ectoine hydroxylase-related dioxygenase (phytanoyl-CoA dioxygenase family)